MEKPDLEYFPVSKSAKKMLGYVSDGFYDNSYVGKWLFEVMGQEYDMALEAVEELPAQFFPETATWGLMYHEIKWGLPVRMHLSYEERRKLIYQKRNFKAPMTPCQMEIYLRDATGFEVHVADACDLGEYGFVPPHSNVFKVYFIGEGTLDTRLVFEILDRLKQSHTTYRVNDRMEIRIYCRDMEQAILRNIRFKSLVPFWYENIFDGAWILDGSILLNSRRSYALVLGIRYVHRSFCMNNSVRYKMIVFSTWIKNNMRNIGRTGYRFIVNFWNIQYMDGSWILDGKYLLASVRRMVKAQVSSLFKISESEKENICNITVETKTKDYWFFDGALSFGGSRNFDSIYRKEIVE